MQCREVQVLHFPLFTERSDSLKLKSHASDLHLNTAFKHVKGSAQSSNAADLTRMSAFCLDVGERKLNSSSGVQPVSAGETHC